MTASVKKQAAKIASKVIKQAGEQAKATVQEKQTFIKRLEESNQARETEGRDAFNSLRRLKGEKLAQGDETIIARHLYDELLALKRHLRAKGMGIGEFCSRYNITDASESSKELHRLTLPPDKDPNAVRLRRAAGKYRLLIEAISKVTNESASSLADRVLMGTSLHPAIQLGSLSEAEKLQTALQRIVDKIDSEFGLYAKFMETAKIKSEHIASGGKEHWPLWEPISPFDDCWRRETFNIPVKESDLNEYAQEIADASDAKYAFWKRKIEYEHVDSHAALEKLFGHPIERTEAPSSPYPNPPDSGALQDSEFFYVPHAPLGVIEFANLADRNNSIAEYEQSIIDNIKRWRTFIPEYGTTHVAHESAIQDDLDSEMLRPVGQLDFSEGRSRGTDFAWLIIYPTQDGSRLMPMLYIAYQEGGPYILPLDARNLEIFRDAIWLNETEHMSGFDRIKKLIGYLPGTPTAIEDGLRRTAPWFGHNPHFKIKQQRSADLQMLDAFCQKLWKEK